MTLAGGDVAGLKKALDFYKDGADIERLLQNGRTLTELNKLADSSTAFQALLGGKYASLMADARALRADPAIARLLAGLTDEEVAGMIGYTSHDYTFLNAALRSGDPAQLLKVAPYIDRAVAGLDALPNYTGLVYRGVESSGIPAAIKAQYKVGGVIEEAAFTSSSYVKGANFSGDWQYTIVSKTGKQIDFLSQIGTEKEVLFRPGTRFKILDITTSGGKTFIRMMEL
jgi:hypothetical protein